MENKIEIKPTTSLEELTEIFKNNDHEDFINAVHAYMRKQAGDWYEQYDRANKVEKELAEIKATILNWSIKQMKQ